MNKTNKFAGLVGFLAVLSAPATMVISCGAEATTDTPGNDSGFTWDRSDRVIEHDGQQWLVIDNDTKYDENFGKLDNIRTTDPITDREESDRANTGQPFSFRGYPKEMATYSVENHPDIPFQSSWKTLVEKDIIDAYKSTSATNGATFTMLDGVNSSTANTPIAGVQATDNKEFNYDMWQYTDVMNSWGGSGAEGLLNIPPADWINVAHRNGVPILGTFFGPPQVYGGVASEILALFEKVGDTYPYADHLIKIAKTNNFDGWVYNFETEVASHPDYANLVPFLKYLHEQSVKENQIIQIYGSTGTTNAPSYQDMSAPSKDLYFDSTSKETIIDQYLVDYRHSFGNVGQTAESTIGSDYNYMKNTLKMDDETIARLASYGLEMGMNGMNPNTQRVLEKQYEASSELYGDDRHKSSLWSFTYWNAVGSKGEKARETFWSTGHDSADVRYGAVEMNAIDNSDWDEREFTSISNLFTENTVLNSRNTFATSFNSGLGQDFYIDGKAVPMTQYTAGFTSLASQDILPTYRWWTDTYDASGSKLTTVTDWDDNYTDKIIPSISEDQELHSPYFGANSLVYSGTLKDGYSFDNKLYATDFKLEENDEFSITYTGDLSPKLAYWTDGLDAKVTIEPETTKNAEGDWKTATFKVTSDVDTMKGFGVEFLNETGNDVVMDDENSLTKVGELRFTPHDHSYNSASPSYNNGYSQGVFRNYGTNGWDWELPSYRMAFDDINNADDIKFMKYSTKVGDDFVAQGLNASMGIWVSELDYNNDTVEIDGVKYFEVKVDFYREDNTHAGIQNILVKATIHIE